MPTVQVGNGTRKVFSKRSLLLISAGIIVAMLVAGSIFFFMIFNTPGPISFSDPTEQAQDTLNSYVNALNDHNTTAAWNLLSPSVQSLYQSIENFNESVMIPLQQSGWHAQINDDNSGYGTIATFFPIPMQDVWTIIANLGITHNNSTAIYRTVSFNLKTYTFSHYQPSNWKINCKFTG
jgi:hypothetical protein